MSYAPAGIIIACPLASRWFRYPDPLKPAIEIEIKIPLSSPAKGRNLLTLHGFSLTAPRVFEENLVLDDADRSLLTRGVLLRVRRAGKVVTCTTKGVALPGRHKRREEHEFTASGLDACLAIFNALGYREAFRYEKFRTEYAREGKPGHIMLDETPIGTWLELEGPARWIDHTAKTLGFAPETWVTSSYVTLYNDWCEARGMAPTGMVFTRRRPR